MAMKKKERNRINALHLAMDIGRAAHAPIRVETVLADAKRLAKFLNRRG